MINVLFLLNLSVVLFILIKDEVIDELLYIVILCIVLGVVSVLGIFGNFLVFFFIMKFDNLRVILDLFIFSLFLFDLLVIVIY